MTSEELVTVMLDTRPIQALDLGSSWLSLGELTHMRRKVDAILPYSELGEMSYVTWYAVISEDEVIYRINGKYVVGVYYI